MNTNQMCALLKEKGVIFVKKKWKHFAKVCNSKSNNVHVNEVHTQPEYPDSESDFNVDSILNQILLLTRCLPNYV